MRRRERGRRGEGERGEGRGGEGTGETVEEEERGERKPSSKISVFFVSDSSTLCEAYAGRGRDRDRGRETEMRKGEGRRGRDK